MARGYGMVYRDELLILPNVSDEEIEEALEEIKQEEPEVPVTPVEIHIPRGSSAERISRILVEYGIIEDTEQFLAKARERKVTIKLEAGNFQLYPNLTADEIIDELLVPEGRRAND